MIVQPTHSILICSSRSACCVMFNCLFERIDISAIQNLVLLYFAQVDWCWGRCIQTTEPRRSCFSFGVLEIEAKPQKFSAVNIRPLLTIGWEASYLLKPTTRLYAPYELGWYGPIALAGIAVVRWRDTQRLRQMDSVHQVGWLCYLVCEYGRDGESWGKKAHQCDNGRALVWRIRSDSPLTALQVSTIL